MAADLTVAAETLKPARRSRAVFGLSWRILGLVVVAVMTAEILIFLPSIARFRVVYLEQLIEKSNGRQLERNHTLTFSVYPSLSFWHDPKKHEKD